MSRALRATAFAFILCGTILAESAVSQDRDADLKRRVAAVEEAVGAYEKGLSWEARCRDYRLALTRLKLEKARLLLSGAAQMYFFADDPVPELQEAEALVKEMGRPLRDYDTAGRHELAYLSPIDLSPEPFLVYVPTTYDRAKPSPLLIFLHGYDSFINKCNWTETMYSPAMQELAEKTGFLAVMPYARSNNEFMGVGEAEALNTLRIAKELYNVDESRVIMSGASMGGSGALSIACHYPQLFAGVFTITARIDYYGWMGVKKESLPRFKQIQADLDYPRDMLRNLLHVPVFLFHGAEDRRPYPEVEQSRLAFKLLTDLGQSVKYREFAGQGHNIWTESFSHPELGPWMKQCEAPRLPKTIKFTTMSAKYHAAYWAEIAMIEEWGKEAGLDATAVDPTHITLGTTNISSLSLRPENLVERDKEITITLNGKPQTMQLDQNGVLTPIRGPNDGVRVKTSAICGPVRNAHCSRFLIVYGTAGSAEEDILEESRARQAAQEWVKFTQGNAHVKADVDVTEDDIRDCNLILYGSPFTNGIVGRIAAQLPIKIERDSYVVGERRAPRKDAGLMMIYPNPLNEDRYVVVCDGIRWGRALAINHKLDLVPDFIIFTDEISRDGSAYDYLLDVCGTNQHICAGYFDTFWDLRPELTWWANPAAPH